MFFIVSSVEYMLLGIGTGWIRVFTASQCNRLARKLLEGRVLGYLVITAFAIGALVMGSRLQTLQTLLMEVRELMLEI